VPTYQYACTECGHAFEQVQSFSDASLTVCPVCEGRLRKVFNAVGVVFKGSGFYRNDSRSASSTSDAPAAAKESGSADSGTKDSGTKDSGTSSTPAKESSSSTPSTSAATTSA
jgi:putative FmdB family regulatory protein